MLMMSLVKIDIFLVVQKFLADHVAEGSKNRPMINFGNFLSPPWRFFILNWKQKSYGTLKSGDAEKSKTAFTPPFDLECHF